MERECLDCGSPLRGRTDKKFCDDLCRSNYNNQLRVGFLSSLRPVNAILRKNYSILSKLCTGKKAELRREELLRSGFDLSYHTHRYTSQKGEDFCGCYDFGYTKLEDDIFLVEKHAGLTRIEYDNGK